MLLQLKNLLILNELLLISGIKFVSNILLHVLA